MASAGGVQRARKIPMWPLIVGAGLLAAAVVLLKIFERGSLPLSMGINGLTVGLCGVVLVTVWIAPRAAGLSSGLLTKVRPAVGRLLGADIRRYTLLFAFLGRAARREHQLGHRLEQHATARHRADRRGEGRPTARRLVDQRAIGARSARRPDFRRHIRVGDRAPLTGGACRRVGSRRSRQGRCRERSSASRRAIGTAKPSISRQTVR